MYENATFSLDDYEDPIGDESPPKIIILISILSLVLLALSLALPWISLAPPEIRNENMNIFQDWIQNLQSNNPNIKGYLDQFGMSSEINLRLEPLIDKQGFEQLRMVLKTIPSIKGIRLLSLADASLWVKILVFLEICLVVLTLLWLISSATRIESKIKQLLAGIILTISSVSLLFVFGLSPTIETLGYRNRFGLVLLMTIFEARPGIGLWIGMVANISLGTTFLFYLVANDVFPGTKKEDEPVEWY